MPTRREITGRNAANQTNQPSAVVATTPVPVPAPIPVLAPARFIDKKELLRRVPYSYQTIWHMMNRGEFPRSRNIGGKAVWLESEVEEWIISRPIRPLICDRSEVA